MIGYVLAILVCTGTPAAECRGMHVRFWQPHECRAAIPRVIAALRTDQNNVRAECFLADIGKEKIHDGLD
jgi:hypothetical protein